MSYRLYKLNIFQGSHRATTGKDEPTPAIESRLHVSMKQIKQTSFCDHLPNMSKSTKLMSLDKN